MFHELQKELDNQALGHAGTRADLGTLPLESVSSCLSVSMDQILNSWERESGLAQVLGSSQLVANVVKKSSTP